MMAHAVWKFPIFTDLSFTLPMPRGARILSAQTQRGEPQMWALVDPDAGPEEREFRLVATGERIQDADRLTYIGTVQMNDGLLVFHLFEVMR